MIQENKTDEQELDLIELIKHLWLKRIFVIKISFAITFLGVFIALFSPVMYTTSCLLLPEKQEGTGASNQLLQRFGGLVGLGGALSGGSEGSIPPQMYPQIVRGYGFLKDIIHEPLSLKNGSLETSLFDFYENHYDRSLVEGLRGLPLRSYLFVKSIFIKKSITEVNTKSDLNYIVLTQEELGIVEYVGGRIDIMVDELNNSWVYVKVELQDPSGAVGLNQLVVDRLIDYLTKYKMQKATEDLDFISAELLKAERRYKIAQNTLANFVDRNRSITSEIIRIDQENLNDQRTLTFELYKSLAGQLEQAKLTLQREKPIFKVLQPVTYPIEKSSPQRIRIVFISLILGAIVGIALVLVQLLLRTREL